MTKRSITNVAGASAPAQNCNLEGKNMPSARLYIRRNGSFGASCDGVEDIGFTILEDSGYFTIYDEEGNCIIKDSLREKAEEAITLAWRAQS